MATRDYSIPSDNQPWNWTIHRIPGAKGGYTVKTTFPPMIDASLNAKSSLSVNELTSRTNFNLESDAPGRGYYRCIGSYHTIPKPAFVKNGFRMFIRITEFNAPTPLIVGWFDSPTTDPYSPQVNEYHGLHPSADAKKDITGPGVYEIKFPEDPNYSEDAVIRFKTTSVAQPDAQQLVVTGVKMDAIHFEHEYKYADGTSKKLTDKFEYSYTTSQWISSRVDGFSGGVFNQPPSLLQQKITPILAGTTVAESVSTAANTDLAAIAVDANDATINIQSSLALKRFSSDAGFTAGSFSKTKKRALFRNLMKEIVTNLTANIFNMNDKTEFLKFVKPADDSIDLSTKLKDIIEIIKPSSSKVTVNMNNSSVYVPFEDGESQTIVDSVTDREFTMGKTGSVFTLTIAPSSGSAHWSHALPPNFAGVADQEGQVYTYVDSANSRETIFVWGSGTVSSNTITGQAQGDPYITTLAGVTYKMDDFTGFVRLLQGEYEGKIFTINAENKLLTKPEIKELLEWRQTKMGSMNFSDNVRFGKFPAYFSKFYVSHGDQYAIVDANSLEVLETNYEPKVSHSVQINKGYVWSEALKTISRADLTVGELQMSMMSYEDKDIRNGFKLFNMDKLQNRSGALEHPIYVKDMKIRSIRSVVPIKQVLPRKNKKIIKEEIIENGIKTQHTFKVF